MNHRRFPSAARLALGVVAALAVIASARAADIAAGRAKARLVCTVCHGVAGIGVAANFPNLAGQKELYLAIQLRAFKAGRRRNDFMNTIARQLGEEEIDNLAAFFASLPCRPGAAPESGPAAR